MLGSSSVSGELVVAPKGKTASQNTTKEIVQVTISSPPSFGDLTPPTPPTPSTLSDTIIDISAVKIRKSIKHGKTWPEWVNHCHLASITLFFMTAIAVSIIVAVVPFTHDTSWWTDGKENKAKTGFRTFVLLLHAIIDGVIFGYPYLIWYKAFLKNKLDIAMGGGTGGNSINLDELPMTRLSIINWDKPTAQKKFYYSYTIDEGRGKQVATFGVSISNILFALIVLFRYQSLLPRDKNIFEADANEHDEHGSSIVHINFLASKILLFLGLATRVAASGVPTFTVKKFPNLHYFFTGSMFMLFGAYMITEVFFVDPGKYHVTKGGNSVVGLAFAAMGRRICCLCYWFAFWGIFMFGKFELNGLSSLCELLALFFQEMYIFSYIISFRRYDSESPML